MPTWDISARAPMRIAWFGLVAPALVLNYFGQGALLIADPKAVENPFYLLLPDWALYPMVALATAATVIASQATISGAYSMTKQAIQLGFLPRMSMLHTSAQDDRARSTCRRSTGCCWRRWSLAVIGFGSSSRLASAYGVAVTGTMLVDTLLTFFVIRYGWGYPLWLCLPATGFFIVGRRDLLRARPCSRSLDGGWFPLLLGALVFTRDDDLAARPRASLLEQPAAPRRSRSSRSSTRCSSIRRSACRAPRCS